MKNNLKSLGATEIDHNMSSGVTETLVPLRNEVLWGPCDGAFKHSIAKQHKLKRIFGGPLLVGDSWFLS